MVSSIVSHQTYLQDVLARQARRRLNIDPEHVFPTQPTLSTSSSDAGPSGSGQPSKANVVNYVPEEETIRNDYTAWYGVSGQTGANYILGAGDNEICEEYPALRRLMDLKSALVSSQAHPPLYLHLATPSPESLTSALVPHKFDVILVRPRGSWSETADLPIRQLSADPGFVFLWVGRGDQDGLERGRECLARWGFRRAEDIVWVKTNKNTRPTTTSDTIQPEVRGEGDDTNSPNRGAGGGGLFSSQKEHCLMGIRGTVRRSTDTRFVHCNVDTDVMVWEQEGEDAPDYPPYLYTLVESFCLGTRRLQLFAPPRRSRRGWITASTEPLPSGLTVSLEDPSTSTDSVPRDPRRSPTTPLPPPRRPGPASLVAQEVLAFDSTTYPALLPSSLDAHDVLPFHPEIETLRPKSPQRRGRGAPPSAPGGFGGTSPPPSAGFRGAQFRGGSRGRGGRGGMPGQMGSYGVGVQQPYSPMGQGYGPYDQFGQPLQFPGHMYDPRLGGMGPGMPGMPVGMDPMMALQLQQMQQMQMMGMGMGMGAYGMNPGINMGQPGFMPMGYGMQQQMGVMQPPTGMQQIGMQGWKQPGTQYGQPPGQGQGPGQGGDWSGGQAE